MEMCEEKQFIAVITLLARDSYFRPGEATGLTVDMTIKPSADMGDAYRNEAMLLNLE